MTIKNNISLSEYVEFVNIVTNGCFIETENGTEYCPEYKDFWFTYCTAKYFTDLEVPTLDENTDYDEVYKTFIDNKELVDYIKNAQEQLRDIYIDSEAKIEYKLNMIYKSVSPFSFTDMALSNLVDNINTLVDKYSEQMDGMDIKQMANVLSGIKEQGNAINAETITKAVIDSGVLDKAKTETPNRATRRGIKKTQ